jgi:hypothetical protein
MYYAYYYTDLNVDPKDSEEPFKYFGTSKFFLNSLDMFRKNDVYLRSNYLVTD